MAEDRFDGLFMNAVQQAQGIENFFDNLFSFMRRKTDLFTQETTAKTMINSALDKHTKLFNEDKARQAAIAKKKAEEAQKTKEQTKKPEPKKPVEESQVMEVTDEEARQIELEEAAKKAGKPIEPKVEEKKEGEEDGEGKGQMPNQSNGGNTDKYNWGQTLNEVTVNVYLPDGTTSKMMNVVITAKKCSVKIKNGATILEGEWNKPIKVEDSPWCIETDSKGRKILQLNLTKKEGQNWWDCVLQGDEKINTQKVEPENSKLGDLDNETRSVVEKMMFDQQQKQKGLPTSDELEKKNKLKAFMDAHPEMDFSKAKFS